MASFFAIKKEVRAKLDDGVPEKILKALQLHCAQFEFQVVEEWADDYLWYRVPMMCSEKCQEMAAGFLAGYMTALGYPKAVVLRTNIWGQVR